MQTRPYICENEFKMRVCHLIGGPHAGTADMVEHTYGIVFPTDEVLCKCTKLGADTGENEQHVAFLYVHGSIYLWCDTGWNVEHNINGTWRYVDDEAVVFEIVHCLATLALSQ